jgi:hypothetical protein
MGIVAPLRLHANFSGGGVLELLQQIVNEPPPKLPEGYDYKGLDVLIERCLVKEPDRRPRPEELMVFSPGDGSDRRKIRSLWQRRRNKSILQSGPRRLYLQSEMAGGA